MKRESNVSPKKKWAKPKLIILTRGRPGEGVLEVCKGAWEGSPSLGAGNCGVSDSNMCWGCADLPPS